MAADCSFDIVSQFDEQELVNALDQTRREVQTRYDLKDTKTEIARSQDAITILKRHGAYDARSRGSSQDELGSNVNRSAEKPYFDTTA